MIQILSDSCSDLNRDLLKKHQISILPLNVFIDNQTFHDGENISIEELFQKVAKTGELPKTSAPSLMEFNTFFSPVDHGIYIGISSELSAPIEEIFITVAGTTIASHCGPATIGILYLLK
jgi:fatty acid-binding protein DegV